MVTHEAGGFLDTAVAMEGSSRKRVLREWVSSNSCVCVHACVCACVYISSKGVCVATKPSTTDLLCGYSIDWFTLVEMCYKCRYGCTGGGRGERGEGRERSGVVGHSHCLLC